MKRQSGVCIQGPGYVYVLKSGAYFRIGRSWNPEQRCRQHPTPEAEMEAEMRWIARRIKQLREAAEILEKVQTAY